MAEATAIGGSESVRPPVYAKQKPTSDCRTHFGESADGRRYPGLVDVSAFLYPQMPHSTERWKSRRSRLSGQSIDSDQSPD
jgi:hypothetical protein